MPLVPLAFLALGCLPFAFYFALKRPLLFPFGLYLLLVPIDALLDTTATATVTKFIAAISAAAMLGYIIVHRRMLIPPKSWIGWATYMVLCTLTALWTIDPEHTGIMLSEMLGLFAFFTVVAIFPAEPRDVRIVGGFVVAAGTWTSLWALVGYEKGFREQGNRLSLEFNGFHLDPNHIAACLLLPIALAVGTVLATRDQRLRFASLAALGPMILTLLLTGSRGGIIALGVMMLYIAWTTRYRLQIILFMALGGVLSLLEPTVWDRFNDKGLAGGSGRLFIWDVASAALKHYGLIGAGIGAFPAAYDRELLSVFQPTFQGWSRPAHDAFLSAFVEVGIVGGLVHIYAWYLSWKEARGNTVIEAAVVGMGTASLFLDVLFFKYVWLVFMMAILVKNASQPNFLRGRVRTAAPVLPRRTIQIPARRRSIGRRPPRPVTSVRTATGTDGARIA